MGIHHNPDVLLELAKARIREFHQEAESRRLAKEARHYQPRQIRGAVKQAISLIRILLLKKRIVFGRIQREKAIHARRDSV